MSRTSFVYQPGDCQTHVFVKTDERGREQWFRYCFTHNDGSNKHGKHPRGHSTERDARMSERDHVIQMRRNRQALEAGMEWANRLTDATSWDEFIQIYCERYSSLEPYLEREDSRNVMLQVQDDYRKILLRWRHRAV